MSDIYEKKALFVKELQNFYKNTVWNGHTDGLKRLDYHKTELTEWVYVTYNNGSQKCFAVSYQNNCGILFDFVRFLENFDDFRWLREEEKLFREEFLEDEK